MIFIDTSNNIWFENILKLKSTRKAKTKRNLYYFHRQRRHLGPSTSAASFSLQTSTANSPTPLNLNHQSLPTASLVTFHPGEFHVYLFIRNRIHMCIITALFAHFFHSIDLPLLIEVISNCLFSIFCTWLPLCFNVYYKHLYVLFLEKNQKISKLNCTNFSTKNPFNDPKKKIFDSKPNKLSS